MATALNPLGFLLGHTLLEGTGFSSVRDLLISMGLERGRDFLHGKAVDVVTRHADRVAAKMTSDGWKIGATKKGKLVDAAAQVHDLIYRVVALFIARGGFVKDQFRDAIDHAIGAGLVGGVPAGDPTVEWVQAVGLAVVDYGFSFFPTHL